MVAGVAVFVDLGVVFFLCGVVWMVMGFCVVCVFFGFVNPYAGKLIFWGLLRL